MGYLEKSKGLPEVMLHENVDFSGAAYRDPGPSKVTLRLTGCGYGTRRLVRGNLSPHLGHHGPGGPMPTDTPPGRYHAGEAQA